MIPLIFVSSDKKILEKHLKDFLKENDFSQDRTFYISPLKEQIVIDQIRQVKKQILLTSSLARLYIFYNFDTATAEAQNAFLKSLEEGAANNQFILSVKNEYSLLPTIRSRSRTVRLENKENKVAKNSVEFSEFLKAVETGSDYKFLVRSTLTSNPKDTVKKYFLLIIEYYRKLLSSVPQASSIIRKTLHYNLLLEENNLNPQVAFDNLLIFIFKAFRMKI